MDHTHVRKTIISLLKEIDRDLDDKVLAGRDYLFREIGLDSLSMIRLVVTVEDRFGIRISEHEAYSASSIARLVDLVRGKVHHGMQEA